VARVTVSAPVPPISVLTLLTVPVLVKLPSVSVFFPAPRSIDTLSLNAEPSVMLSLLDPPMIVLVLDTVAVLVKLLKVTVLLPPTRLTLPLVTPAA
jgi:hypothetical protein